MHALQSIIDEAWESRAEFKPGTALRGSGDIYAHFRERLDLLI